MYDSSFYSLLVAFVVGFVVVSLCRKGNATLNSPMTTLVLTKFRFQETDDSDELVVISGRQSGLIGWLLVRLGLGAETTIQVKKTELSIKSSSLSGEFYSLMSLKNVASSHCGFYKPVSFLILAVLFVIIGLAVMLNGMAGFGIFFLVFAVILFVLYYFKKLIRIMVQTKGGGIFGMCFSPSFLEGVNVNIAEAREVVDLINKYMLVEQKR